MKMTSPHPIDVENAVAATIDAQEVDAELTAMSALLTTLRPFDDERRARVLAGVAAMLGHYSIAIELLQYAREVARG